MLLQKLAEARIVRSAAGGEPLMLGRPAKSSRRRLQIAPLFQGDSQVVIDASQAALQRQVAGSLPGQTFLNIQRLAKCARSLLRAASPAVKEPQMIERYRQITLADWQFRGLLHQFLLKSNRLLVKGRCLFR